MGDLAIRQRLTRWYGGEAHASAVDSLHEKLGVGSRRPAETTTAAAFEGGFLLGDVAPELGIHPDFRQDFFHLAALLGTDRPDGEIAEALRMKPVEVASTIGNIALDLGFDHMEHPGAAFITLAGMAELLPASRAAGPSELPVPMTEAHEKLFPLVQLYLQPFDEHPEVKIRFAGQPKHLEEADINLGIVDQIELETAIVGVHNVPFMGADGRVTRLTRKELVALAMKSVGVPSKEISQRLASQGVTNGTHLVRLHDKLLPPAEGGQKRNRSTEMAIRAAFQKGIFTTKQRPTLALKKELRQQLYTYTDLAADGKTDADIAPALDFSASGSVAAKSAQLRKTLGVQGASSLVLLAEADRFYGKTVESELPPEVIQAYMEQAA